MAKLDKISITGFKSFKEVDSLSMGNINVLIGPNGSGKSNFVQAFELVRNIIDGTLQKYVGRLGGADNLLHFGRKQTRSMTLYYWFGQNRYKCELAGTDENRLYFEKETAYFHGPGYDHPYGSDLGVGHSESKLSERADGPSIEKHVLQNMASWQIHHFNDTTVTSGMRGTGKVVDASKLNDNASNLAPFLYALKESYQNEYRAIGDSIRAAAPFLDELVLEPDNLNPDLIRLRWRHNNSSQLFDVTALSDGTLRFVCLATLLLQPRPPALIILDEPELGLHPHAIALLAELVRVASLRAQIILSTQSVTLVDQFSPDETIVADRVGNVTQLRRPDRESLSAWLEEYTTGELWMKNLLGGRP